MSAVGRREPDWISLLKGRAVVSLHEPFVAYSKALEIPPDSKLTDHQKGDLQVAGIKNWILKYHPHPKEISLENIKNEQLTQLFRDTMEGIIRMSINEEIKNVERDLRFIRFPKFARDFSLKHGGGEEFIVTKENEDDFVDIESPNQKSKEEIQLEQELTQLEVWYKHPRVLIPCLKGGAIQ